MDLNICAISGRFVKDPELRKTASGNAVCTFCVACNDLYSKADKKLNGEFFNVVCYDFIAENVAKYFRKGTQVMVDGRLNVYKYTGNDGIKHSGYQILANHVNMAGKTKLEDTLEPQKPETGNLEKVDVVDDDLPF